MTKKGAILPPLSLNYGVTQSSLEDVFVKVCGDADADGRGLTGV